MPWQRITFVSVLALASHANAQTSPGELIATQGNSKGAPACAACHGSSNADDSFPRLDGLNSIYLFRQLDDFRHNRRASPVMTPIAKALSAEETRTVAEYYAALTPAPDAQPQPADAVAAGQQLATRGSWADRQLPACAQCHGPDGSGISSTFPALAAQRADYIKAQLNAWQAGSRSNDPLGLMQAVADKLSADEITAVASYYASLTPAATHPPDSASPPALEDPAPQAAGGPPLEHSGEIDTRQAPSSLVQFTPPAHGAYPAGPLGEAVRNGEAIFLQTNSHPLAGRYVGNQQQCGNCHLDAGRLAGSAPMWAAWVAYPAYRSKNKQINDITMRVQGCFIYSMNAHGSRVAQAPARDSQTMTDLISYMYWLSSGAPSGDAHMAGRGYPALPDTALGFDVKRGAQVYLDNCALCHGYAGEGVLRGQLILFPPLWGRQSYNWGAGMHKINTAAAFIKANMPLGKGQSLSDQQAWDVAAFINSMPRPQDPRFAGDLDNTAAEYHNSKYDLYRAVQQAGKGLTQ